uniref:Glucuronosyltransferase n=1 Tax=Bursaphelenchus xylophilus TaxID=6326 RepID=A0A1I7RYX1_BURXY
MNSFFVALFLLSLPQVHGYRYLFQVINFAYSHMSFGGRLADLLVENGHEVDFVIRRYNTFVSGAAAKKANVSVHTLANVEELNQLTMRVPMYHDVFTQSGDAFTWEGLNVMDELMTKGCDATLEDKGYMNLLRSKNTTPPSSSMSIHADCSWLMSWELTRLCTSRCMVSLFRAEMISAYPRLQDLCLSTTKYLPQAI